MLESITIKWLFITLYEGVNWLRLLQGRIHRCAAVSTLIELRIVQKLRDSQVTKSDITAISSLSGSVYKTALCVVSDSFRILKIGQTELIPELLKMCRPSVPWTARVTSSTGVQTAPAMADIQRYSLHILKQFHLTVFNPCQISHFQSISHLYFLIFSLVLRNSQHKILTQIPLTWNPTQTRTRPSNDRPSVS